jgi:hypothetical protein
LAIGWDADSKSITLSSNYVQDFRTEAHYDYVLSLSLDELGSVLEHLTEELSPEASQSLQSGLAPRLRSIVRLGVICVGGKALLEN